MESTLLLLSLSFVVVIAFGQDTMLQDHHDSTYNKNKIPTNIHSARVANNVSLLEDKFEHKLREAERRMSRRLHEHSRRVQDATGPGSHLDRTVQTLVADLAEARLQQATQQQTVADLQQLVGRQQHEIHRMRNGQDRMRKTVENLSSLVEQLIGSKAGLTTTTEAPSQPPKGTLPSSTALPFTPIFPVDCQDVFVNGGMKYPGFYYIMIQPYLSTDPFKVCCKMTNNSGWTLIQRRQDGSVDFFRGWQDYKKGFGNLEGEFWLGNEHIYQLTNQGDYRLRIEMTDWDDRQYYAEYDHFRLAGESDKYRLHVHGYHGNSGDSLSGWNMHDKQAFSTNDNDNDNRFYDNCAEHYHGAWWFKSCFESHLNGVYYHKGSHNNYFVRNGIQWNSIHVHSSLKYVSMMIKPTEESVTHEDSHNNDVK